MKRCTPQLTEDNFLDLFPSSFPVDTKSTSLLERVVALTDTAEPEVNKSGENLWKDFYLPLRRGRKRIALPTRIYFGEGRFTLAFGSTRSVTISQGEEQPKQEYVALLEDIAKLVPFLQQDHSLPEKLVPYDIRTGTIQGKYVLEEVMPQEEKQRILKRYEEHLKKNLTLKRISLDDYLATAALCYRAAFGKETEGLSPSEMYRRWADGRHGGMLELKSSSKRAFMRWLKSDAYQGCHPFEILFSGHNYGITLRPPGRWDDEKLYSLNVGVMGYAEVYVAMLDALIKKEVPVRSHKVGEVLEYLCGESTFFVNRGYGEKSFWYTHSAEEKKKYFPHIMWDTLKMPKWKKQPI